MISKLPKWIEYGALVLAMVAGCINVIGLLGFEHQAISHLSGSATLLGNSIYNQSYAMIVKLSGILVAFFIGASVSGFLLKGNSLRLGRHYDTALLIEAFLLCIAYVFLSIGSFWGAIFASMACGLQNALATTYSGAIVRTTHLTGIFTDLGIMVGEVFRTKTFDKRKAILFLLIIVGFIGGGAVGAWLYYHFVFQAILFPAAVCFVLAGTYHLYQKKHLST